MRTLARARTLTVLGRLDRDRKRSVLQFLHESRLIDKEQTLIDESALIERRHMIVSFARAALLGADLSYADLSYADLREAILSWANLREANLTRADLTEADLLRTNLHLANLMGCNLRRASLIEAELSVADLRGAVLREASLREADLGHADLSGADLREADLREAKNLTQEMINVAMGDQKTKLPSHLTRPDRWSLPVEEQMKQWGLRFPS